MDHVALMLAEDEGTGKILIFWMLPDDLKAWRLRISDWGASARSPKPMIQFAPLEPANAALSSSKADNAR
jgi:hypothetical protein